MGGCLDENTLLEYVDGLASSEARREIADHLASCAACRAVLAAIGRDETANTPGTFTTPVEILRAYLRADAPWRETIAIKWVLVLDVVTLAAAIGALAGHGTGPPLPLPLILLAGHATVLVALRRGWYHPALAYVNGAIEVSMPFAMSLLLG